MIGLGSDKNTLIWPMGYEKKSNYTNQFGLERSLNWSLIWDRIKGDMGRSDSISLIEKGEGKWANYLTNERRKGRIKFVEWNYLFCGGEEKQSKKRRKIFRERKYILGGNESQRRKREKIFRKICFLLEEKRRKKKKENWISKISFWRRRKMEKESEENIWRRKILFRGEDKAWRR